MSGLTPSGFIPQLTTDVQTKIVSDELANIDPALNTSPTQPIGQFNGIFAAALANVWGIVAAVYTALDPDSAVGIQLDNICALVGITRLPATKTLVTCNANLNAGTYAAGTLTANIVGYPNYTFVNRDQIVSAGGLITGLVWIATQTGPIVANSGTLTVITTPVAGWNSITNPTNGTTGTNIETDSQLRLRRNQNLVANGSSTVDSIRSTLLGVANVLQAIVIDNPTNTTDSFGDPPYSFQAVVWDNALASSVSLAQAIWNSKPAGIQAFGSSSAVAVDATGANRTVFFTRATQVPIYFAITVKTTNAAAFSAGGGVAAIQNAIAALGALIAIGGTVIAVAFEAAAFAISGVVDITSFTLGTAPAPVGTINIPIAATSIATFATTNVAVTVT